MILVPKNWAGFQHYKDRNPTWIKLHKQLLDDFTFQRLPVASRALAPMLWLLASEYAEGRIEASAEELAFRLRMSEQELNDALKPLIDKGFFVAEQAASTPLAEPERVSSLEKRREEIEKEKRREDGAIAPDVDLWSFGIDLLSRECGLSQGLARSYLGGLCKQWPENTVLDALMAAAGKADPKAYARKWLDDKPRKGQRKMTAAEELMAELEAEEHAKSRLAAA